MEIYTLPYVIDERQTSHQVKMKQNRRSSLTLGLPSPLLIPPTPPPPMLSLEENIQARAADQIV